ncbi:MAG: FIST C-terminal domain-containing protein [Nitrospirae bacterium]|nr:FIST C-terminal domain-containing protein [Nitrospirota bacterium]
MEIEQKRWVKEKGWEPQSRSNLNESAQLVLVFGSKSSLKGDKVFDEIRRFYPNAHLFGCSTAGEIHDTHVSDGSIILTAMRFDYTEVKTASIHVRQGESSFDAGKKLAESLPTKGLSYVFVLSDGLTVNGSQLVEGLTRYLPSHTTLTGGLSGDGELFEETLVLMDSPAEKDRVGVVGFYGDRLKVGCGSLGGWDPFGPERRITSSHGNILYQLDGKSALELYKKYLGEHAKGLPASGLLFPLCLRTENENVGVVRTILSVNEKDQSMTFAGDLPQGAYVRLMKANFDRLIDGSLEAAKISCGTIGPNAPDLAILISCVGRKLVLKQRIEEEVEGVREITGDKTILTGFYSYGEISPFTPNAKCELHNQTMTITTFSER